MITYEEFIIFACIAIGIFLFVIIILLAISGDEDKKKEDFINHFMSELELSMNEFECPECRCKLLTFSDQQYCSSCGRKMKITRRGENSRRQR